MTELKCIKCNGIMVKTGMALYTSPLIYEYKCEDCDSKQNITEDEDIPIIDLRGDSKQR